MKKMFLPLCIMFILVVACGCTQTNNLKKINIVTACGVESGDELNNYCFNVTEISSSEKTAEDEESHSIYKFSAENFSKAVSMLEKTIGVADLGHLSVFMPDIPFLEKELWSDMKNITSKVKINPMIKFFVYSGNCTDILKTASSAYGTSSRDYIEKVYGTDRKNLLCTFSEILFSQQNNFYSASVPVIGLTEDGNMKEQGMVICSPSSGCTVLTNSDYECFSSYLIKNGKKSDNLEMNISEGKISVRIKNEESDDYGKISSVAQRYKEMGYDILNAVYFSKKEFPTNELFRKYMMNFQLYNLNYE